MIFVTVGTQGTFDRLVRTVDEWAGRHGRTDVFAQTGPSDASYRHIRVERFIDPAKFRERVESASLVIAHAGMGSIITALELGKRIIVMPRRASMGEQRNDHQMATAKRFAQQGRIEVAFDESELLDKLDHLEAVDENEPLSPQASQDLIASIRTFIRTGHVDVESASAPPSATFGTSTSTPG
jgi:UDP-N-acetylglucosamine transferase subunit ALG13